MMTRRDFALALGVGVPALAWTRTATAQSPPLTNEIVDAKAIHQTVVLPAPPAKIYEILTQSLLFAEVVRRSEAMNAPTADMTTRMKDKAPLASIGTKPGADFWLFRNVISGFQLELAAPQRIVQAWRVAYWDAGQYSVVRFGLTAAAGIATTLTLDHGGFPPDDAQSLADGWRKNYWEPMTAWLMSFPG